MIVSDHDGSTSPRVLDFGLAKITAAAGDDEATLVQSGHSAGIVGTLMYMAPEALSGRAVDARSDQYSLALITYELLAGVHPFGTAKDLASVVKGHTEHTPPPIRDLVEVSERTANAIHRALSKDPARRFDSVGAFIAEL
jgi:serine/threonine-protein kinase